MKGFIFRAMRSILYRQGYLIVEKEDQGHLKEKNSLLETTFGNLKAMGFRPRHIVDIGANHGTWTRETLKYFPEAQFTMVEPQAWLKSSFEDLLIQHRNINFHPVGMGSSSGMAKFTITERDDSCSFRFTDQEAEAKGLKQVDIEIMTLDELIDHHQYPTPDLIKIDAEGLDLEVMKGAVQQLGKTEVIMLEAAVGNRNFQNSISHVISFMDEKGYVLFDITDMNRPFTPPVLWLVELVFIKKGGNIHSYSIQ